tara:strand:+ start:32 stop:406 length:375 start_codon:yes stop_codon:yes gene_type:complete
MEVDLENGVIKVRDDLEFKFKEIVTRKEMAAIRKLREKHGKLEEGGLENLSMKEEEELEDEWFKTVLPLGLEDFTLETMDSLTEGEIREMTASVYIFLTKFGSTALGKQFALQQKDLIKKQDKQ